MSMRMSPSASPSTSPNRPPRVKRADSSQPMKGGGGGVSPRFGMHRTASGSSARSKRSHGSTEAIYAPHYASHRSLISSMDSLSLSVSRPASASLQRGSSVSPRNHRELPRGNSTTSRASYSSTTALLCFNESGREIMLDDEAPQPLYQPWQPKSRPEQSAPVNSSKWRLLQRGSRVQAVCSTPFFHAGALGTVMRTSKLHAIVRLDSAGDGSKKHALEQQLVLNACCFFIVEKGRRRPVRNAGGPPLQEPVSFNSQQHLMQVLPQAPWVPPRLQNLTPITPEYFLGAHDDIPGVAEEFLNLDSTPTPIIAAPPATHNHGRSAFRATTRMVRSAATVAALTAAVAGFYHEFCVVKEALLQDAVHQRLVLFVGAPLTAQEDYLVKYAQRWLAAYVVERADALPDYTMKHVTVVFIRPSATAWLTGVTQAREMYTSVTILLDADLEQGTKLFDMLKTSVLHAARYCMLGYEKGILWSLLSQITAGDCVTSAFLGKRNCWGRDRILKRPAAVTARALMIPDVPLAAMFTTTTQVVVASSFSHDANGARFLRFCGSFKHHFETSYRAIGHGMVLKGSLPECEAIKPLLVQHINQLCGEEVPVTLYQLPCSHQLTLLASGGKYQGYTDGMLAGIGGIAVLDFVSVFNVDITSLTRLTKSQALLLAGVMKRCASGVNNKPALRGVTTRHMGNPCVSEFDLISKSSNSSMASGSSSRHAAPLAGRKRLSGRSGSYRSPSGSPEPTFRHRPSPPPAQRPQSAES